MCVCEAGKRERRGMASSDDHLSTTPYQCVLDYSYCLLCHPVLPSVCALATYFIQAALQHLSTIAYFLFCGGCT